MRRVSFRRLRQARHASLASHRGRSQEVALETPHGLSLLAVAYDCRRGRVRFGKVISAA